MVARSSITPPLAEEAGHLASNELAGGPGSPASCRGLDEGPSSLLLSCPTTRHMQG